MSSSGKVRQKVRKSQRPTPPKIKFRSSCDACTEAKVRCDKQHPECSRCIRVQSACHYSVSMRTGKPAFDFVQALNASMLLLPPHKSMQSPLDADTLTVAELLQRVGSDESIQNLTYTGQHLSPANTAKCPSPPATDSGSSSASMGPILHGDINMGIDSDTGRADSTPASQDIPIVLNHNTGAKSGQNTASPSLGRDATNINDGILTGANNIGLLGVEAESPGFSLSSLPPLEFDYSALMNLSDPGPLCSSQVLSPSSNVQGAHDGSVLIDPALFQLQTSPHGHSCSRTAKALQKSLLVMANKEEAIQSDGSPLSGSVSPPIGIDQALLTCSSISQQITEILKCRCEADGHLPFLVSVLISKVLATYGAIARVKDSTPFNFGTPSKILDQQEHQPHDDAFVAVALRLGTYSVDSQLEGALRAQIVLHELSKLECMAQLFTEKYCRDGEDEQSGEDRIIYSALCQFIKDRYARTKAACELRSTPPKI
ncbi:hypothetical protein F4802DRAFT_563811 [Xylaria palmicola]|nr:hypothetical protein F4802DRAFT_563811 [Xylaria palmicola]